MSNRFNFPNLGFGMGLRSVHYPYILSEWPAVDWFEILSENYMDTDGRPIRVLEKLREHYPLVMHGVSMSIGTTDPQNDDYLKKLKTLADWLKPKWISDHLCWTGIAHKNTHDLLPIPYTEEALNHIVDRIKSVQDYIGRPLLLENPSTYLEFKSSEMPEWEFIAKMSEKADCGLLLDVNNVYVTCYNHRYDTKEYIDALPADRIIQIHLAGHENKETHIIDTHEGQVIDDVWKLYRYVISRTGPISTMVEWDDNIPDFDVVKEEVEKARAFTDGTLPNDLPNFSYIRPGGDTKTSKPYKTSLMDMQEAILSGQNVTSQEWILEKENFTSQAQLNVYIQGYRHRLFDNVLEEFPVLTHYLGEQHMYTLIQDYIETHPSAHFNASRYIEQFPAYIKEVLEDGFACELAELETALSLVFHDQETSALTAEHFVDITAENLLEMTIKTREALQTFEFNYPVNQYIEQVMNQENPSAPARNKSFLVLYRHEDKMWRLDLEEAEYALFKVLKNGKTIGEALEKLSEEDTKKIEEWFGKWLRHGLLAEAA